MQQQIHCDARLARLVKQNTKIPCVVSSTAKMISGDRVQEGVENMGEFFEIPNLQTKRFCVSSVPKNPRYILYVDSLEYIPGLTETMDAHPMMDSREGCSSILAFLEGKDCSNIHVQKPPLFRNLKTPMVYDTITHTSFPYRAAVKKINDIF